MRIKEAAARCGLTEKAIRLYEEKGMITPAMTEINGRRFRDYDGETIHSLETIAGLRKAFFTMEQIAEMQNSPANTPEVFREYRKELHERWEQLGELIARADAIDPAALDSPDVLADALMSNRPENLCSVAGQPILTEEAKAAPPPPPKETVGIWDEDPKRDARELVYRKYFADRTRWEVAYDIELWIRRFGKRIAVIGIPLVIVLILLGTAPIITPVNVTLPGQEIWFADNYEDFLQYGYPMKGSLPLYAKPVSIRLEGKRYNYLLRPDYYEGLVYIDGWIPRTFNGLGPGYTDEEELEYFSTFHITLTSDLFHSRILYGRPRGSMMEKRDGSAILSTVFSDSKMSSLAIQIQTTIKKGSWSYAGGWLIFPAEDEAMASGFFWEKIWPVITG